MVEKIPLSRLPTPRRLAESLYLSGEDFVALLESGPGFPDRARYTILAWGIERELASYGRYDELKTFYKSLQAGGGPFGGELAVGFVSYDLVPEIEPTLSGYVKSDGEFPKALFVVPSNVVIYDNLLGRAYVKGRIPAPPQKSRDLKPGGLAYKTPEEEFKRGVSEALERIKDGEIFQVVLSRREVYDVGGNLFSLYEGLADLNPSPYMYFLSSGDLALIGTSPELLVKVDGDVVETHPIAGTRPRGATDDEDLALEDELLKDEKELAEHMMLVDLARNDVGRVSRYGTVKARELMAVEKYSHVQHIVSRVSGVLDPKFDVIDALWATFPAGTVSGAPKVRAMEIIGRLEDLPRGPYAGGIGILSPNGGEFAIIIRTIIVKGGRARLQAGAGVVYDSTPEGELKETEYKLAAMKSLWT